MKDNMLFQPHNDGHGNGGGQGRNTQGNYAQPHNNAAANGQGQALNPQTIIGLYTKEWITNEPTPSMIDFAEAAGKYMAKNKMTYSQIRNVYGEIKRIQMGGYDNKKASFYLLRPKVAYAVARMRGNGLEFFQQVFTKAYPDVSNAKSFNNFCALMEAILAYHKANNDQE